MNRRISPLRVSLNYPGNGSLRCASRSFMTGYTSWAAPSRSCAKFSAAIPMPTSSRCSIFCVLKISGSSASGSSHTSFLQKMPLLGRYHRSYLPLMPLAIEQFDLSGYDLVISSSCAVAKGVLTGPEQVHIAYVHSPMRYAWDLQHLYLKESGYATSLKGMIARAILHKMRIWDARTAHRPDAIFTNSQFVARRIKKIYGRDAKVIYPPVSIPHRDAILPMGNHFLAASRLVPYKRMQPIVRAFNEMPDLELIVAGDGPEADRLKRIAGPNVKFVGFVPDKAFARPHEHRPGLRLRRGRGFRHHSRRGPVRGSASAGARTGWRAGVHPGRRATAHGHVLRRP